jgi:hypothetical protein
LEARFSWYVPLRGSSYVERSAKIKKETVINIKNSDSKYFL